MAPDLPLLLINVLYYTILKIDYTLRSNAVNLFRHNSISK